MSEAEAMPLVISSSRVVHVEGCGHVAHYVNGQRLRQFESWNSEREFFNPAPGVEVVVTGQPVQTLNEKWISVRTDREKLATGGAYRRCRHCAPDVPEYEPHERIVSKRAETLVHGDIGRPGVDGIIASILHLADSIEVAMEDGRVLQLLPDERLSFYTRVRNDTPQKS